MPTAEEALARVAWVGPITEPLVVFDWGEFLWPAQWEIPMQETEKTFTAKRQVDAAQAIARGFTDLGNSVERGAYNLSTGLAHIGRGIAWAGFYLAVGLGLLGLAVFAHR